MRLLVALFLLLIVLLSASAHAATIVTTGTFATTRNAQVAWQTNHTLETNSLLVRTNDITIGSQRIDFKPDGEQRVQVYIERYSNEIQTYAVVMTAGARTGLNITYTNPGYNLTIRQAGETTHTCADVVTPCNWALANSTQFNFTILTPTGAAQLGEGGTDPVPSSGGGGGATPGPSNSNGEEPAELPPPQKVFPRLSALQWLVVIVCLVLIFNGIPQLQGVLPLPLHFIAPPDTLLGVGTVGLVLVYLTPA